MSEKYEGTDIEKIFVSTSYLIKFSLKPEAIFL